MTGGAGYFLDAFSSCLAKASSWKSNRALSSFRFTKSAMSMAG